MSVRTPLCLSTLAAAFLAFAPGVRGQATVTLVTLHQFTELDNNGLNSDGGGLIAGLVPSGDGNFYGATNDGGAAGKGTAYEITPDGTLTVLANFGTGDNVAQGPWGAPIKASNGYIYGTTDAGGAHSSGTAYRIAPDNTLSSLHSFGGGSGTGSLPRAGLIQAKDGNLYGTTYDGGTHGDGAIFQLSLAGAVTVVYSLDGDTKEGTHPYASLIQTADGTFYGTTASGGANGDGTVFKLTPAGVLTILHSFGGAVDGSTPYAALIQAKDGNFYGSTHNGGANGAGTVFQITPAGVLTTLHTFGISDGSNPRATLVQGQDGNLYGSTEAGGAAGVGTLFEITPAGELTTLYVFSGGDGANPEGAMFQTADGAFYGTTASGGASNTGTVFKLTVHAEFFAGQTALGNGVYYLAFSNGNYFGYYSYLSDAHYIYHFDLGYEYIFDAADGKGGVYLYDFKSQHFFYSSPVFPFPYLYDFTLKTVLYYYPDPSNPGHYDTDGYRFFYRFDNGQIIVQ